MDSDLEVAVLAPGEETAAPHEGLPDVLARGRAFLPGIKRFLERCAADPAFIDRVRAAPLEAAADAGIARDPREFRHLWDRDFATSTSDPAPPIVTEYRRLLAAKLAFRDRAFAESRPGNARMAAWRDRQIARSRHEVGHGRVSQLINAPFAIELNKGCSVGCWFCGVGAPQLSDLFRYEGDNIPLWRDTLGALTAAVGETAARWGFCYWATDPLDNPDYEKFLVDFHAVVGAFPQTTTALALRDPARTRALLRLAEAHGAWINRFSILTLRQLRQVHAEFTADELAAVECLPQNAESPLTMANSGRARERHRREAARRGEAFKDEAGTIACVSGFLVNMIDRSVRLISPSRASDRWPLGYYVFDEGRFETAADLRDLLARMIETRMRASVEELPDLRLADGLTLETTTEGFRLVSPYQVASYADGERSEYLRDVGTMIATGGSTASELALIAFYRHGMPAATTLAMLEAMFAAGVLNELPA